MIFSPRRLGMTPGLILAVMPFLPLLLSPPIPPAPVRAQVAGSPQAAGEAASITGPLRVLPEPTRPPAFTLPHVATRERVGLSDLHGEVVILNFCALHHLCSVEIEALKKLREELGSDGAKIVLILSGGSARLVRAYVKEKGIDLPVLHDADKKVAGAWGVESTPTTFVLDREGRAVFVAFGTTDWADPLIVAQLYSIIAPSRGPE